MKKVLVVSDNESLIRHIKEVVNENKIASIAAFDLFFSAANKNPGSLVKLGMAPINLKDEDVCEKVIESYDVVLSLHCKQIFPAKLVKNITCINVHPGFNPHNRGWYPQVFSIINKKPIGATIHVMDELVDHGPVIAQDKIQINDCETSFDVYNKVIELEKKLISNNLEIIVTGSYKAITPDQEGNYNSILDFNNLCCLDLNNVGTLRQHIDLLRALTHGHFNNAYYFEDGKKVYVQIKLVPEV